MSDPICRVQNPYPKNVVKLVKNLPHQEMTNESFKKYMTKSEYGADSFFKTYYQLACQLGLYFIDDKQIFHPRFQRDITEKEGAVLEVINRLQKGRPFLCLNEFCRFSFIVFFLRCSLIESVA